MPVLKLGSALKAFASAMVIALFSIVIFTASAQATHLQHWVRISGSMWILDSETWSSDETGTKSFGPAWRTVPLTSTYYGEGCVGGEVKGQVRVTFPYVSTTWVLATVRGLLYEGVSCSTTDLDGQGQQDVWIPLNQSRTVSFRVWNDDEGGDFIDFSVTIRNGF